MYYLRAIMCFFASIFIILLPIVKKSFRESFGVCIAAGIFAFVVGLINYFIAKEDCDIENEKDKRIEELEKELNSIKENKL